MRRSLLSAGLGLTLTGLLAVPALADTDADDHAHTTWSAVDFGSLIASSHHGPVVIGHHASSEARPTEVRPDDVRPDRPDHELEELRMACKGRRTDERRAAIGCEWSPSSLERAAGYRLERADGDAREVVFRTDDVSQTSFVDTEIRVGQRYIYRVVVVNAEGRTIGVGGPVKAGVEADRELEALHLACEARDDASAVGCKWRPAESEAVAGYQLWRAVDRDGRELIHRGGLDVTSHVDTDLGDTKVVHYAVIAVDVDGQMVGRSRAVTVRFAVEPGPRPVVEVRPTERPVAAAGDLASARD